MRTLILATASAIALGIAGATPLYAQSMNSNSAANPSSATEQTAPGATMQPATPQSGSAMQQAPSASGSAVQQTPSASGSAMQQTPSVSGEQGNQSAAATSPSSTDWPRVSRNDVEQAQQKLQQAGLYHGKIDGMVGPETQHALRAYQQQNGLPVTTTLDPQTLSSLNISAGAGVGSSTPPSSSSEMNAPPASSSGTSNSNTPTTPGTQPQ